MSKLRVHSFGMSIDGYGAGPNQNLENPLGVGGLALQEWAFKTRTFHAMVGKDGGETGVDDDDFVARGFDNTVSRAFDPQTGAMLVLVSGCTQYGTDAAAELVTNPELLAEALRSAPKDWQKKISSLYWL